jgi:hypothetical protein
MDAQSLEECAERVLVEDFSTIFSTFFMHKNEAYFGALVATRTKLTR